MPTAAGKLTSLPSRAKSKTTKAYSKAMAKVGKTFAKEQRTQRTSAAHEKILLHVNDWCVATGVGNYIDEVPGKARGDKSCVRSVDKKTKKPKVMEPGIVIGHLLDMATGEDTG